jgi:hypothetical protein
VRGKRYLRGLKREREREGWVKGEGSVDTAWPCCPKARAGGKRSHTHLRDWGETVTSWWRGKGHGGQADGLEGLELRLRTPEDEGESNEKVSLIAWGCKAKLKVREGAGEGGGEAHRTCAGRLGTRAHARVKPEVGEKRGLLFGWFARQRAPDMRGQVGSILFLRRARSSTPDMRGEVGHTRPRQGKDEQRKEIIGCNLIGGRRRVGAAVAGADHGRCCR